MLTEKKFLSKLDFSKMARVDEAVALLWYYEKKESGTEKKVSELAGVLEKEGYGRPNVTTLKFRLVRSKFTVKGRKDSFKINSKNRKILDDKYNPLMNIIEVDENPSILPPEIQQDINRKHINSMIRKINISYNIGNYDCCAVMARRLMESLIIEVYIKLSRGSEIKSRGAFFMLDRLITTIVNDGTISLSRGASSAMTKIKSLGDTAAHHRNYITPKADIDDEKSKIRKIISELLILSGIKN